MNTQNTYVEASFEGFGLRELGMAADLLAAYSDGKAPSEFSDSEVKVGFNMNSGHVFLTNEDYQVVMLVERKLEMFYTCPECGEEGFHDEMKAHQKNTGHEIGIE